MKAKAAYPLSQRRLLSSAWDFISAGEFWLILCAAAILLQRWVQGSLAPDLTNGDIARYLDLAKEPLLTKEALSSIRTVGYPALIKFGALFGPGYLAVPYIQFFSIVFAAFICYYGLRALGIRNSYASILSCGILYCSVYNPPSNFAELSTDGPALYFAVATIGAMWLTWSEKASWKSWFLLAVLLFVTYQIRPSYLFLIPLIPVLSVLGIAVLSPWEAFQQRWKGQTIRSLSVCFLPFLAFCLLRLITVDHFGLVSFGGNNLIGLAGQILVPEMVKDLPEDLQPFAKEVLLRRENPEILKSMGYEKWESPRKGKYDVRTNYIYGYYNLLTGRVAHPIAVEMYGPDNVKVNNAMSRLSFAILRLEPIPYCMWIARAFTKSVLDIFKYPLMHCFSILCGIAYVIFCAVKLAKKNPDKPIRVSPDALRAFHVVTLTSFLFFTACVLLVISVETAVPRYIFPACVFMPIVVLCLLVIGIDQIKNLLGE